MRCGAATSRARRAARCRWASWPTPPRRCPRCSTPASRSTSSPTRPARTTRSATCPPGCRSTRRRACARPIATHTSRRPAQSMAQHCRAMVAYQDRGAEVFDYGNSLRGEAVKGGFDGAFAYPGFVPAYIRPQFCEGRGPFRWVALSGDPADIARDRRRPGRALSRAASPASLAAPGRRTRRVPGPARAHLLVGRRRAAPRRVCVSTSWCAAARCVRPSSSVVTTSTPAASRRRTARPRRCATAATPSPTGRSSMRCSTPPAARPGWRCTTAAAWVSAAPSTPARRWCATAPSSPTGASSWCCATTRPPG